MHAAIHIAISKTNVCSITCRSEHTSLGRAIMQFSTWASQNFARTVIGSALPTVSTHRTSLLRTWSIKVIIIVIVIIIVVQRSWWCSRNLAFWYWSKIVFICLKYFWRTHPWSTCSSLVEGTLAPGSGRPLKVLARIAVQKGFGKWKFSRLCQTDGIGLRPAGRVLHSGTWAVGRVEKSGKKWKKWKKWGESGTWAGPTAWSWHLGHLEISTFGSHKNTLKN